MDVESIKQMAPNLMLRKRSLVLGLFNPNSKIMSHYGFVTTYSTLTTQSYDPFSTSGYEAVLLSTAISFTFLVLLDRASYHCDANHIRPIASPNGEMMARLNITMGGAFN